MQTRGKTVVRYVAAHIFSLTVPYRRPFSQCTVPLYNHIHTHSHRQPQALIKIIKGANVAKFCVGSSLLPNAVWGIRKWILSQSNLQMFMWLLLSSLCKSPSFSWSLQWLFRGWDPVEKCDEQTVRHWNSSFSEKMSELMAFKYLGASLSAVHDSVAAVKWEGVLKSRQTFLCEFITGVNHPPVCLWDNNSVHCYFFFIIRKDRHCFWRLSTFKFSFRVEFDNPQTTIYRHRWKNSDCHQHSEVDDFIPI